jgi:hypothetical protein
MICNKCGTENAESAKFCVECGTKVELSICDIDQADTQIIAGTEAVIEAPLNKSFGLFLTDFSWWWVPLTLVSMMALTSILVTFIIIAVWSYYQYLAWKRWVAEPVIIFRVRPPLRLGRLLLAIALSFIAAKIIADGPDRKSYLHDLPYEAALESGYSSVEAERMIPQIIQMQSIMKPDLHTGLFFTATGWLWFLPLFTLFSWRGYILLAPSLISDVPHQTESVIDTTWDNEVGVIHENDSVPLHSSDESPSKPIVNEINDHDDSIQTVWYEAWSTEKILGGEFVLFTLLFSVISSYGFGFGLVGAVFSGMIIAALVTGLIYLAWLLF